MFVQNVYFVFRILIVYININNIIKICLYIMPFCLTFFINHYYITLTHYSFSNIGKTGIVIGDWLMKSL